MQAAGIERTKADNSKVKLLMGAAELLLYIVGVKRTLPVETPEGVRVGGSANGASERTPVAV